MRTLPRVVAMSVASLALAVGWVSVPGAAAGPADPASASRHIVVLHEGADSDAVARDHGRRYGAEVKDVYRHALKGYVATFKGTGAADVARDPRVDFVELDRAVSVHGTQTLAENLPWGLDRIDQANLPLSKTFQYTATGNNVTAYIIDTGIRYDHKEVAGRAAKGFDAFHGDGGDCDGHGTHVAGTVGGTTSGVAKEVKLVSVRVLDCNGSGSWSGVISGIEWVTTNHTTDKAVANMSLGGPASSAVDLAVSNSILDGVTYVVAAGNGNQGGVGQDACKYSPARVAAALTIGATDITDTKSGWSNYGKCVDGFAPGVGIVSADFGSDTARISMSGTSMAAPHTAGAVALYLQTGLPMNVDTIRSNLFGSASAKVRSAGKGTMNDRLLLTRY
jgi:subtilisin family serine protease